MTTREELIKTHKEKTEEMAEQASKGNLPEIDLGLLAIFQDKNIIDFLTGDPEITEVPEPFFLSNILPVMFDYPPAKEGFTVRDWAAIAGGYSRPLKVIRNYPDGRKVVLFTVPPPIGDAVFTDMDKNGISELFNIDLLKRQNGYDPTMLTTEAVDLEMEEHINPEHFKRNRDFVILMAKRYKIDFDKKKIGVTVADLANLPDGSTDNQGSSETTSRTLVEGQSFEPSPFEDE